MLTSALVIDGELNRAGTLVEVSELEARNFLHRGKARLATVEDGIAAEDESEGAQLVASEPPVGEAGDGETYDTADASQADADAAAADAPAVESNEQNTADASQADAETVTTEAPVVAAPKSKK